MPQQRPFVHIGRSSRPSPRHQYCFPAKKPGADHVACTRYLAVSAPRSCHATRDVSWQMTLWTEARSMGVPGTGMFLHVLRQSALSTFVRLLLQSFLGLARINKQEPCSIRFHPNSWSLGSFLLPSHGAAETFRGSMPCRALRCSHSKRTNPEGVQLRWLSSTGKQEGW